MPGQQSSRECCFLLIEDVWSFIQGHYSSIDIVIVASQYTEALVKDLMAPELMGRRDSIRARSNFSNT